MSLRVTEQPDCWSQPNIDPDGEFDACRQRRKGSVRAAASSRLWSGRTHRTVRWKGGALTDMDVPLPRSRPRQSEPTRRRWTSCAASPHFTRTLSSRAFSIDRAEQRSRMTDALKARFTASAGEGFITMQEATRALGVTRQTVLQRVKRGEIAKDADFRSSGA